MTSIKYNAAGYYDPTAYAALQAVIKEEKRMQGNTQRTGEIWELESGRVVVVIADDGLMMTTIQLYEDERGVNDVALNTIRGRRYGSSRRLGYAKQDQSDVFLRSLTAEEHATIKRQLAENFQIPVARRTDPELREEEKDLQEKAKELEDAKTELSTLRGELSEVRGKLTELKETIADIEEADGKLSQAKTARFLRRYIQTIGL